MDNIPLDAVELPEWMVRYNASVDLSREAMGLARQARDGAAALPGQWPRQFEPKSIDPWMVRARSLSLPADEAGQVEEALETITAEQGKLPSPDPQRPFLPGQQLPDEMRSAIWSIVRSLEAAGRAIEIAAGKMVRARGQLGVALAIVGTLYRESHSAVFQFRDGTEFGIDDDKLQRFLTSLLDEGVLEDAGGSYCVRLTEYGRRWFEEQISGGNQSASDEEAAAWSDARADVLEAASHLGFMASEEFRGIALGLLREIEITMRAGASLATMILCGSFVETMLLDLAEQIPNKLAFTAKPNWSEKVSLKEMLDELHDVGLVGDTQRAVAIADHRDLVHPNRRRRQTGIRIDPKSARAMALLANIVAHDLDDATTNGKLDSLKQS